MKQNIDFKVGDLRKLITSILDENACGREFTDKEMNMLKCLLVVMSSVLLDHVKIVPSFMEYLKETNDKRFYPSFVALQAYIDSHIDIE